MIIYNVIFKEVWNNNIAGDISGHFFFIPDYKPCKILLNALRLEN